MKRYIIIATILFMALDSFAQTENLDSLLNEVLWSDKKFTRLLEPPSSFFYMYGGITGDQKALYAGRELEPSMSSWNGSLYLFHEKGLFAGFSGTLYNPEESYNTFIASAGFNNFINKAKTLWFRAAYNRYFYAKNDSGYNNPFNNSLSTGFTLRNSWVGGRVSASFLFGEDFAMNFIPSVFFRLPLIKFGAGNKLQFEPDFSAYIGSEAVAIDYLSDQQSGSQIIYTTENKYGLLNTQLYFPLCVYLGNFDIELGYYINLPRSTVSGVDYPTSKFIIFSLGYLLPLN